MATAARAAVRPDSHRGRAQPGTARPTGRAGLTRRHLHAAHPDDRVTLEGGAASSSARPRRRSRRASRRSPARSERDLARHSGRRSPSSSFGFPRGGARPSSTTSRARSRWSTPTPRRYGRSSGDCRISRLSVGRSISTRRPDRDGRRSHARACLRNSLAGIPFHARKARRARLQERRHRPARSVGHWTATGVEEDRRRHRGATSVAHRTATSVE